MTFRRTAAAAAVAAALVLVPASASTAAKPDHDSHAAKSQLRQLLKDIDGVDARLQRLAASNSMTRLADDHESALVSNIEADRAELAAVAAAAQADPAYDTRAARRSLRELRVQNYQLAIAIVRGAERVSEDAAAVPEAAAELALAVEGALATRDETDKDALKDARRHLESVRDLLDDADDADDQPEDEPEVDSVS